MATCFVIQPFDRGKFDKRYNDVFKPAIEAAGLEPYRVDEDLQVVVPIDAIEEGIKAAAICLAEISTDNPNVWYELGFAFATGRPVVMVCSQERADGKYPFDIQHRTITRYDTESSSDFAQLQKTVTERLEALIEKGATLRQMAENDPVAPVKGLSQVELMVLAAVGAGIASPDGHIELYAVRNQVERAGLTNMGFALGIRRLRDKSFISIKTEEYPEGRWSEVVSIVRLGWEWIEANESLFSLRRPKKVAKNIAPEGDDVPF